MKLWIDNTTQAPDGYVHCDTVAEAKEFIEEEESFNNLTGNTSSPFSLIDVGSHDEILNWLSETGRSYPIRLHSEDSDLVKKMREVITNNGWEEVM